MASPVADRWSYVGHELLAKVYYDAGAFSRTEIYRGKTGTREAAKYTSPERVNVQQIKAGTHSLILTETSEAGKQQISVIDRSDLTLRRVISLDSLFSQQQDSYPERYVVDAFLINDSNVVVVLGNWDVAVEPRIVSLSSSGDRIDSLVLGTSPLLWGRSILSGDGNLVVYTSSSAGFAPNSQVSIDLSTGIDTPCPLPAGYKLPKSPYTLEPRFNLPLGRQDLSHAAYCTDPPTAFITIASFLPGSEFATEKSHSRSEGARSSVLIEAMGYSTDVIPPNTPAKLTGDVASLLRSNSCIWLFAFQLPHQQILVAQPISPTSGSVNGGKGLIRFGLYTGKGIIQWNSWIPLPVQIDVENKFLHDLDIYVDDGEYFLALSFVDWGYLPDTKEPCLAWTKISSIPSVKLRGLNGWLGNDFPIP